MLFFQLCFAFESTQKQVGGPNASGSKSTAQRSCGGTGPVSIQTKEKEYCGNKFQEKHSGKKHLRDLHRDAVMPTLDRTHEYTPLTGNQWSITKGEMSPHPL